MPPLTEDAIARALEAGCRSLRLDADVPRLGRALEIHETLGSTNDRIDALALSGAPEGMAVFAETQTAGRGRGGNRWSAPPGRNLTFSVLLRPSWPLPHWPRLAHVTGLAVARGAQAWSERIPLQLKWPNDILADDRKLAGILLEVKGPRQAPYLVLGIGLNANSLPEEFPPELSGSLTSLRALHGGASVDRSHLAGAILAELTALYVRSATSFPEVLAEVAGRSSLLGRRIRFLQSGTWRDGELIGFAENGEMRVRLSGCGTEDIISAAETVRPIS